MIIVLYCLCLVVFFVSLTVLVRFLRRHKKAGELWQPLVGGFVEALRGSGMHVRRRRYPAELWVWEAMDDDAVCEESRERSHWPPMDIADWMKEGMPHTPESGTEYCADCTCRLVPYKRPPSSPLAF